MTLYYNCDTTFFPSLLPVPYTCTVHHTELAEAPTHLIEQEECILYTPTLWNSLMATSHRVELALQICSLVTLTSHSSPGSSSALLAQSLSRHGYILLA